MSTEVVISHMIQFLLCFFHLIATSLVDLIQGHYKENAHNLILLRGNSKTRKESLDSNQEEIMTLFKMFSAVFKLTCLV
jgi:hypothetical protein